MFVITLRFTGKDWDEPQMADHRIWVEQGFAEGAFVLIGPILPRKGGVIIAVHASQEEVAARVAADPLVKAGILAAEILEIGRGRAIDALTFLFSTP